MYDVTNEIDSIEKLYVYYNIKRDQFIEDYKDVVKQKLWFKLGKSLNLIKEDSIDDWIRQYLLTIPGSLKEVDGVCVLDHIRSINTLHTWITAIKNDNKFTISEYDYRWFVGAKATIGKDIFTPDKPRYVDERAEDIIRSIREFDKFYIINHNNIKSFDWYQLKHYKDSNQFYTNQYDQYIERFGGIQDDEVLINIIGEKDLQLHVDLGPVKDRVLNELENLGLIKNRPLFEGSDVWVFKLIKK